MKNKQTYKYKKNSIIIISVINKKLVDLTKNQ